MYYNSILRIFDLLMYFLKTSHSNVFKAAFLQEDRKKILEVHLPVNRSKRPKEIKYPILTQFYLSTDA